MVAGPGSNESETGDQAQNWTNSQRVVFSLKTHACHFPGRRLPEKVVLER